jgi:hypothetical protein
MLFEGAARYNVLSEDSTQPCRERADQQDVVVAQADVRNHRNVSALSTRSDILQYEHKRASRQHPIERVLFHLAEHDWDSQPV